MQRKGVARLLLDVHGRLRGNHLVRIATTGNQMGGVLAPVMVLRVLPMQMVMPIRERGGVAAIVLFALPDIREVPNLNIAIDSFKLNFIKKIFEPVTPSVEMFWRRGFEKNAFKGMEFGCF